MQINFNTSSAHLAVVILAGGGVNIVAVRATLKRRHTSTQIYCDLCDLVGPG